MTGEIITRICVHQKHGDVRPSAPPVRSTVPTPARSTSPSKRAASSRSTAATRTRSPTNSSAPRSAASPSASTAKIGCSTRPSGKGPKGQGDVHPRARWDEALDHIATRMMEIRDAAGAEAILPFCYGGSNGLLTQDTNDAALFRGFGTSRLARTVCAAPTGAANQALYGKMPGVTYHGLRARAADRALGREPGGVRHSSRAVSASEAREAGRQLVVVDPRATSLARQADLHICRVRPGTDLPVALALHRYLFENGHADQRVPRRAHARAPTQLRARAREWTFERAAEVAGIDRGCDLRSSPRCTRSVAGAGPLRLGPRAQPQRRQRRGRGAGAAGRRRKVRRPRRRLLDEQLRRAGESRPRPG